MPKKLFKRYLPTPEDLEKQGTLNALGSRIHDPNLWHLNRHTVSRAVAIGLFTAFFPIPGQMVLAACFALFFRANLPLSVILVWISNPITIPPLFYATYKLGAWMLNEPVLELNFEFTLEWLDTWIDLIWEPLLLGCFTAGAFFSVTGYVFVKYFWRWHVIRAWKERKAKRQ